MTATERSTTRVQPWERVITPRTLLAVSLVCFFAWVFSVYDYTLFGTLLPVIAEDFGWCVPVVRDPYTVYVACAGSGEPDDEWRVFAFVEPKLLTRLLGRDRSAEPLAEVFAALEDSLSMADEIRELAQEEDV